MARLWARRRDDAAAAPAADGPQAVATEPESVTTAVVPDGDATTVLDTVPEGDATTVLDTVSEGDATTVLDAIDTGLMPATDDLHSPPDATGEVPAVAAAAAVETDEPDDVVPAPLAPLARRALAVELQERTDDLGGLILEMARRERFNHEVLELRAREALAIERLLEGEAVDAGDVPTTPCPRCAAPSPVTANFCAACGSHLTHR